MQLGLTLNQARTYLALTQTGPATAHQLSKNTNTTRQDIYRITPQLQKKGIIEQTLTTPTTYKATPIQQTITTLLQNKNKEQNQLQKKTQTLLNDLKNSQTEKQPQQEENTQFTIIPQKEAIIQKLKEGAKKAQTSIDVVTSPKRFSSAMLELAQLHKKALGRGVKIQIVTQKHTLQHAVLKIMQMLQKNPDFKVRYFPNPPEAIITIIDKKEAFVTMSATAHLKEAAALQSNNPCFVALAQNYFQNKWDKAQKEETS
jgi:sugar-specific transcriptional regulator TrmB